jgi:hypothetical protein
MKKFTVVLLCVIGSLQVKAQTEEIQQLLLNVEKLAQLKQILADMKQGFAVVSKGYQTVAAISKGNFNIHDLFLGQLLQVSPSVRKYYKVKEIVEMQLRIIGQCKETFPANLSASQIRYAGSVYKNLLRQSLSYIEDLSSVLTARKLRMSDEERLRMIDVIHEGLAEQIAFADQFKNKVAQLASMRKSEQKNIAAIKEIQER